MGAITVIFALLLILGTQTTTHDHCDLVELNSFHDINARHVYDQIIFYEWNPSLNRYHVRAWVLSDGDKQPQRDYRNGLYLVRYTDRDSRLERRITATHYRRSYSQIDPERDNKKLLDERERHALTKRLPITPIPDDAPMEVTP